MKPSAMYEPTLTLAEVKQDLRPLENLFLFDLDDVIIGPRKVILVSKAKRLLIENLTDMDIDWLSANRNSLIDLTTLTPSRRQIFEKLAAKGIAVQVNDGKLPKKSIATTIRISSGLTHLLCSPFQIFTYPSVLIALVIINILAFEYEFVKIYPLISINVLMSHISMQFVFISLLTTIGLSLLHELGHAAASVRLTGMTGGIRIGNLHGMIAFAVDVTPVRLTTRWGRVSIASAGISIDLLTCLILLSLFDDPAVKFGASLALISTVLNLLPFPKTDGFWALNDALQKPLVPIISPIRTVSARNFIYGWALLLGTLFVSTWMIYFSVQVIIQLILNEPEISIRKALIMLFFFYTICIAIAFCKNNLQYVFISRKYKELL